MNQVEDISYHYKTVKQFTIMAVIWGIVGMLVGVIIAAQLAWPALNLDIPWLSYGRLRPLHTNAVIFAFGGCALFGASYYIVQRTCKTTLAFWQLIVQHLSNVFTVVESDKDRSAGENIDNDKRIKQDVDEEKCWSKLCLRG